jgi:hypothetical protein
LGVTVTQLCGRIIQSENYTKDRPLGELGQVIFENKFHEYRATKEMSCDEAEYWKNHEMDVGVRDWTNSRLRCGKFGMKVPSKNALFQHEKKIYYPLMPFRNGFRATLPDILCKTLTRLFLCPELAEALAKLEPTDFPLMVSCATGLDGAGSMSTANQVSRNELAQGNRITVEVCLHEIKTQQGAMLYDSPYKASPNGMRPWIITPDKETDEVCNEIMMVVDPETKVCRTEILKAERADGSQVEFTCEVKLALVDGKMVSILTGMGGSYCKKCKFTIKECHDKEVVKNGFVITQSIQNVNDIWDDLFDADFDEIRK